MTDGNTPDDGTVDSLPDDDDPLARLDDILGDPETDTDEDVVDAEDDSEDEVEAEADADEDTETDEDSEDSDEDAEEESDEPESTGGRFVEHTARVKLSDGTTTTVEDLAKSYFRQSDYTRKSQENATEREAIQAERERVNQTFQDLHKRHEQAQAMLDQWRGPAPQDPDDIVGWVQYQQQTQAFDQWQSAIDQQREETKALERQEQERLNQEFARTQRQKLIEKIPAMADEAKSRAFLDEATKVMGEYGFTAQEVAQFPDYRYALVLRDLIRAKRATSKAPAVQKEIGKKPKMLRTAKRGDNPQRAARTQKFDRLRKTGTVADAVAVLNTLDL